MALRSVADLKSDQRDVQEQLRNSQLCNLHTNSPEPWSITCNFQGLNSTEGLRFRVQCLESSGEGRA